MQSTMEAPTKPVLMTRMTMRVRIGMSWKLKPNGRMTSGGRRMEMTRMTGGRRRREAGDNSSSCPNVRTCTHESWIPLRFDLVRRYLYVIALFLCARNVIAVLCGLALGVSRPKIHLHTLPPYRPSSSGCSSYTATLPQPRT